MKNRMPECLVRGRWGGKVYLYRHPNGFDIELKAFQEDDLDASKDFVATLRLTTDEACQLAALLTQAASDIRRREEEER